MAIPGGGTREAHKALAHLDDLYSKTVEAVDAISTYTLESISYADDLIDVVPKSVLTTTLLTDIIRYCGRNDIDKHLIPKAADRLMRLYRDKFVFLRWDSLIVSMRQYKGDEE